MSTESEDAEAADKPTMAPFLAALAIFVIVVIGIWLVNLFQGDRLTEDQRVGRAAVAQNDALQRDSYADFVKYTCAQLHGSEADVLAHQRDSVAKHGNRFVDNVTGVRIDGEKATGTVTYHFDKAPDAKTSVAMSFAREDGAWKVCSTGPS